MMEILFSLLTPKPRQKYPYICGNWVILPTNPNVKNPFVEASKKIKSAKY